MRLAHATNNASENSGVGDEFVIVKYLQMPELGLAVKVSASLIPAL